MKFNEIVNILETYEEETRKGWYSYTFENGNVGFARLSNPEKRWRVDLKKNMVEEHLSLAHEQETYFWKSVDKTVFDYNADDYVIDPRATCVDRGFVKPIAFHTANTSVYLLLRRIRVIK